MNAPDHATSKDLPRSRSARYTPGLHARPETNRRGALSDPTVGAVSARPALPSTHSCDPGRSAFGTGRIVFPWEVVGSGVGAAVGGEVGGRRWIRCRKWASS